MQKIAPKLKKYAVKPEVITQVEARIKNRDKKYKPHFVKDGTKYRYINLTDDIVDAILGKKGLEKSVVFCLAEVKTIKK